MYMCNKKKKKREFAFSVQAPFLSKDPINTLSKA